MNESAEKKPAREFWDGSVRRARERGESDRSVSMPPGVLFFENLYLWERAVMEPISGRRQDTPIDWFFRTFVKEKAKRALSLSCGTGFWERRLVSMGFASRVDAFDTSESCLEWASELAAKEGLSGIEYRLADANTVELPKEAYDFAVSVAALHHVENLEHLLAQVSASLKPGGWLVFDEYVGPNRMQWSDRVLEIVNEVLGILPERYRISVRDGLPKVREERFPVEKMIEIDPSEGVRSEEIIPLVERYFQLAARRQYGGAILMPLFMNIVGNFDAAREEDRMILDFCLLLEKTLLREKVVPANGVLGVARRRP